MDITKANKKDIPSLINLVNSAYRGEQSKKGWTTEANLLDGMRTDSDNLSLMLRNPDAIILKYNNDENELQGCVYLEKNYHKMYVGMLSVSPTEQAKGIGKRLLSVAEKYAIEQQCSLIEMTVISVRDELINWYVKHGYLKTGEVTPFPSDNKFGIPKQPLEFIVMQKKL